MGKQHEPGHFLVDMEDLPGVRAWFLAGGRHPKCVLKDEIRLKSLVYSLTKRDNLGKGVVVVHGLPEEAGDIQEWIRNLGIDMPYRGEGLPAISAKVLHHLIRHGREMVWLSGEEKAKLLEQHGFLCICGRRASSFEWDHVERFSESMGEQRFQPLCPCLLYTSDAADE